MTKCEQRDTFKPSLQSLEHWGFANLLAFNSTILKHEDFQQHWKEETFMYLIKKWNKTWESFQFEQLEENTRKVIFIGKFIRILNSHLF